MSLNSFVMALCLGAAVLAIWIVARFPALGPAKEACSRHRVNLVIGRGLS